MAACSNTSGDRPQAMYDSTTGRLRTITFDFNKNGKNDAVSYMDGARIIRVETDLDENGKIERWDFYGPDRTLEKVGFSRLNDGIMDAQAFYDGARHLQRMEVSTRRDGRFDKTEFYTGGILIRSEEDTDGDSRIDKWDTYAPLPNARPGEPGYGITSTAVDDSGTGTPRRRFTYGPNGRIVLVEVDPEGDGTFVVEPGGRNRQSSGRPNALGKTP
jgi:hypothetical protein